MPQSVVVDTFTAFLSDMVHGAMIREYWQFFTQIVYSYLEACMSLSVISNKLKIPTANRLFLNLKVYSQGSHTILWPAFVTAFHDIKLSGRWRKSVTKRIAKYISLGGNYFLFFISITAQVNIYCLPKLTWDWLIRQNIRDIRAFLWSTPTLAMLLTGIWR